MESIKPETEELKLTKPATNEAPKTPSRNEKDSLNSDATWRIFLYELAALTPQKAIFL